MRSATALLALLATACTALPDGDVPFDGDGGAGDAGAGMDGAPGDAGPDAGVLDSGPLEAGPLDSGAVDAGDACVPTRFYPDCDGDSYGDSASPGVEDCETPPIDELPSVCTAADRGWVEDRTDCNDFDPSRNPGAAELCDGRDSDCSGVADPAEDVCDGDDVCVEGAGCRETCPLGNEYQLCTTGCVRTDSLGACGSCTNRCWFGCRGTAGACEALEGLASGVNRTCGWTTTGDVTCWGSAPFGADPGPTLEPLPVHLTVPAAGRVIDMDVGPAHACVIREESGTRSMSCWGANRLGQAGGGPDDLMRFSPGEVNLAMVGSPVDVEVGDGFTCVANADGAVFCWGRDVGAAEEVAHFEPFLLGAFEGVQMGSLYAGDGFLCGLDVGNALRCAGTDPGAVPVDDFPPAVVANRVNLVAAGRAHLCWSPIAASPTPITVSCRGSNMFGQVDSGSSVVGFTEAQDVLALTGVQAVELVAGGAHTCLSTTGLAEQVHCWGANGQGQSGVDSATPRPPVPPTVVYAPVSSLEAVLALGGSHTCLLENGARTCWGRAVEGQFGMAGPPSSGPSPFTDTSLSPP